MKEEKDLFNRFREKDRTLGERPSANAWKKLEAKLDNHLAEKQAPVVPLKPRFQWLKIAAGLAIIIGAITLLRPQLDSTLRGTQMAANDSEPFIIEDLEYTKPSGFYALAIQTSKYYHTQPSILAEGDHEQRLQITDRKPRMANRATSALALNETPVSPSSNAREKNIGFDKAKNEASAPSYSSADYKAKAQDKIADNVAKDATSFDVAPEADDAGIAMEEKEEMVVIASSSLENVAKESEVEISEVKAEKAIAEKNNYKAKKRDATYAADEITYDANAPAIISAQSNAISYESSNVSDVNIDYFKWLIGNWEASVDGKQNSVQNWNQKDQFTLTGKAVLTINGEELSVEKLEIKKIDNQLYFLRVDTKSGETVKYNLVSINGSEATFSNARINDQFSLRKNAMDNFSQRNLPNGALQLNQFPGALESTINFEKVQKD